MTTRDIEKALTTATSATLQDDGTWKLAGGYDRDQDELTLIVAFEGHVLVVTIF